MSPTMAKSIMMQLPNSQFVSWSGEAGLYLARTGGHTGSLRWQRLHHTH